MSFSSAFRSPAVTLSDFLRSLAVPRVFYGTDGSSRRDHEFEILRERQGGTKRLDFFDHDLIGPEGAVAVLRAVEQSPSVTDVIVSHNHFGDDGLRELVVGLKRLRSRDIGAHLEELNLSDCNLSDVSLHLIALHLLQPSPHPPSLKALFLNHNHISLGSSSSLTSIGESLGATLSSSSCSLRSLAFTSNRGIGPAGLVSLLSSLRLAAGPSQLSELRLSVTNLTPECAEPIARWLEDPEGGARLQVLSVNACALGTAGVRRIARAVTSGKASSMLHLEHHANESGDDEQWSEVNAGLSAEEEEDEAESWKEQLSVALKRNQEVLRDTRRAARRLAAPARVLFGGNAVEAEQNTSSLDDPPFPFLRLPIELQVHVLRCTLLLEPSSTAHLYPSISTSPSSASAALSSSSTPVFSSPLTETQFLRILSHSATRSTLETGRRIAAAHAAGQAPSLNPEKATANRRGNGAGGQRESSEQDAAQAWEDWFLRCTGCNRFERAVRGM
ncbi:hypothetical protein JCM8547_002423 [Rhodosporidiobolus lusitaniae]